MWSVSCIYLGTSWPASIAASQQPSRTIFHLQRSLPVHLSSPTLPASCLQHHAHDTTAYITELREGIEEGRAMATTIVEDRRLRDIRNGLVFAASGSLRLSFDPKSYACFHMITPLLRSRYALPFSNHKISWSNVRCWLDNTFGMLYLLDSPRVPTLSIIIT